MIIDSKTMIIDSKTRIIDSKTMIIDSKTMIIDSDNNNNCLTTTMLRSTLMDAVEGEEYNMLICMYNILYILLQLHSYQ